MRTEPFLPAGPQVLRGHPVIAVIRASTIPNVYELCRALLDGGITAVEFTYGTPEVERHVRHAVEQMSEAMVIGAGAVLTESQAEKAVAAGAQFLATPCLRPEVVAVANNAGIPTITGAMTPSEIQVAWEMGSAAVKVFPARCVGPQYLSDVRGPMPEIPLMPSGGVGGEDAASFLAHGAAALFVGGSVVAANAVAAGDWSTITRSSIDFTRSLSSAEGRSWA